MHSGPRELEQSAPGRFYHPSARKVRNAVIMQNSKECLVKHENEFPHLNGISENTPMSHDIGKNFLPELRQPLLDLSSNV